MNEETQKVIEKLEADAQWTADYARLRTRGLELLKEWLAALTPEDAKAVLALIR